MFKKSFRKNNYRFVLIFIIGAMLWCACKKDVIYAETYPASPELPKISILPFKDMSAVYGEQENIRCPICGKIFLAGKVAENASNTLTEYLHFLLQDRKDLLLIPAGQAQGVWEEVLSRSQGTLSERELIIKTGQALGVDAVIVGHIYRFRERVGNQYSVDSPASVSFDMHQIRVSDGRVVWSGHFEETQRSLSENLFQLGTFIQRKARWITAREMATSGLENIIRTLRPSTIRNE